MNQNEDLERILFQDPLLPPRFLFNNFHCHLTYPLKPLKTVGFCKHRYSCDAGRAAEKRFTAKLKLVLRELEKKDAITI